MRKELVDRIQGAMEQQDWARKFYHRLAHLVSHPQAKETSEYPATKAGENKGPLHQCLTPEGCPVISPGHDLHLAEHLKVSGGHKNLSPKAPWPRRSGVGMPCAVSTRPWPSCNLWV